MSWSLPNALWGDLCYTSIILLGSDSIMFVEMKQRGRYKFLLGSIFSVVAGCETFILKTKMQGFN